MIMKKLRTSLALACLPHDYRAMCAALIAGVAAMTDTVKLTQIHEALSRSRANAEEMRDRVSKKIERVYFQ